MKSILFIIFYTISFNALASEDQFNDFESELLRLESNQVVSAPDIFLDELTTNQSAVSKEQDEEISKIIPLPGFEDLNDTMDFNESENAPKSLPKRKRSF